MEEILGENAYEYYKAMGYEIWILIGRDKWEVVTRKSFADHNVPPGTWYFK